VLKQRNPPKKKKRTKEEEHHRLVRAERILHKTQTAKDELKLLYAEAMERKVRKQRAKIKAHDQNVINRDTRKYARLIAGMEALAPRAPDTPAMRNWKKVQDKLGYLVEHPTLATDHQSTLPRKSALTGKLEHEYHKRVPKSSYYFDALYLAEDKKVSAASSMSPREIGRQYAEQAAEARLRRKSANRRKKAAAAAAGDGHPSSTKLQRATSAGLSRPAMPSLGLDLGWETGNLAHKATKDERSRTAGAAKASTDQKAKERKATRQVYRTNRMSHMLARLHRNMEVAREMVDSFGLLDDLDNDQAASKGDFSSFLTQTEEEDAFPEPDTVQEAEDATSEEEYEEEEAENEDARHSAFSAFAPVTQDSGERGMLITDRVRSGSSRRHGSSRVWTPARLPQLDNEPPAANNSRNSMGTHRSPPAMSAARAASNPPAQRAVVSLTMAALEEKSVILEATPPTIFNKVWIMPAF
jgi:hypothetical protein